MCLEITKPLPLFASWWFFSVMSSFSRTRGVGRCPPGLLQQWQISVGLPGSGPWGLEGSCRSVGTHFVCVRAAGQTVPGLAGKPRRGRVPRNKLPADLRLGSGTEGHGAGGDSWPLLVAGSSITGDGSLRRRAGLVFLGDQRAAWVHRNTSDTKSTAWWQKSAI